jgi:glycosyltransferase involved in cell wall biosynthesis
MRTRPKISIVTPVLNGERYIRECVESVLSQHGAFELEYIVKDGASRDGTLNILAEYAHRCRIVSTRDTSPQQAINAGLAMATGEICGWLNADDCLTPGALQKVVSAFQRRPDRHWCYGNCSIIDAAGREIRKPITLYKSILGHFYNRHTLLCENYINQPATFWKRSLWQQAGGLDPRYRAAFDYHLWVKMASLGPALPIHSRLAQFRRHNNSISWRFFERQFAEELAIASRYGNRVHRWVHSLNKTKIVSIYKLLGTFER